MTRPPSSDTDHSQNITNNASEGMGDDNHQDALQNMPEGQESSTDLASLRVQESFAARPKNTGGSIRAKATLWAIALSALPVLVVGTAFYLHSGSINRQIQARQSDPRALVTTQKAFSQQQILLLLSTGTTAIVAAAIAAWAANRAVRPVIKAATDSDRMVNHLRQDVIATRDRVPEKDELTALQTNLKLVKQQLPELILDQKAGGKRFKTLIEVTRRLQQCPSEEDVYRTTVEEVRQAFSVDRVVVFRLDSDQAGTFVEESVAPGLPKTLWSKIADPCFSGGYLEQYRNGRVRAIDNIYEAGLGDCHINMLEQFAVKADLIAPIIKDNRLFGLLIAHQCFDYRFWQQDEIGLFAQIATQVGMALDYARLVERVDTKASQAQDFINLARRIRESLYEEDILQTTVTEIRKVLRSDRVIVYCFDEEWYGTVVAEAVLPGWPKALQANIKDPCFAEGYVDKYQQGRVQAIDDIYAADLGECYLQQLEAFAVKANLVAPILKDNQLFGLLIAHQCSQPRHWRQPEIDLFAQIAMQVGFALDHARLLQRVDAEGMRSQLFFDLTRRIRESLYEEDILQATVTEIRKVLRSDRVIAYCFDEEWYGTVVAEAVLPGWPKALQANIKDPCFAEGYVDKYQQGRVQAIDDIYAADLGECYLQQLEQFAVKANLVAPILKDNRLFGLLIAHQCSQPRHWRQPEIDLFAQIAMQVGFALDHARLLNQVEQAYQAAETMSQQQRQQKETLQSQVSELLNRSQVTIESLSREAVEQLEIVSNTYNQLRNVTDSVQLANNALQQTQQQRQQIEQGIQSGGESLHTIVENLAAIRETTIEAAQQQQNLDQPSQKLIDALGVVDHVISGLKIQATNAGLEATRIGENGQQFASIAQKIIASIRQLDENIAQIKPLVVTIRSENQSVAKAMKIETQQASAGIRSAEEIGQKLEQIAAASAQINKAIAEITEAIAYGEQISTSTGQTVLEVANTARQISERSVTVAQFFNDFAALTEEL